MSGERAQALGFARVVRNGFGQAIGKTADFIRGFEKALASLIINVAELSGRQQLGFYFVKRPMCRHYFALVPDF